MCWSQALRANLLRVNSMESSQKTRLILVVCANVLLSATVAVAIWTNADKAKDAKETAVASDSASTTSSVAGVANSVGDASGTKATEVTDKFPVSKRDEVQKEARKEVGTNDPMKSLRTASTYAVKAMDDTGLTSDLFVSKKKPSSKMVSYAGFVPPPPPDPVAAAPVHHVAAPVARFEPIPHTSERKMFGIKVTGIIGNRAMLLMRKEGMSRSEKPEVVCLAPGEQVRNINSLPVSVLSVDKDRVTLEVDGDRFVKTLPEIR